MSKKKVCLLGAGLLIGALAGAAAAYVLFAPEEMKDNLKKKCPVCQRKCEAA